MESSQQLTLMALGLLIVIFAGTLALRLGISLKDWIMEFSSLFPFIVGLSVWVYGTILLVYKLQSTISDNKISEKTSKL